ncbi:MAG TPA: DUF4845 domain-containing protein [Gammaproteobacteria bacterium]|jgi:hypothetical protein|nr:DUF4845 domain-containing protein [Gammaproteobacteria bacterium]
MQSKTHQRGMTGIGWLIVLALIGFFVLLALRMVPAYLDYYKVVSTLEAIEEESGFSSPREIRDLLGRRFDISFVSGINPQDVEIKPAGNKFRVTASYEKREHVFSNVYVVMEFEKQVMVTKY